MLRYSCKVLLLIFNHWANSLSVIYRSPFNGGRLLSTILFIFTSILSNALKKVCCLSLYFLPWPIDLYFLILRFFLSVEARQKSIMPLHLPAYRKSCAEFVNKVVYRYLLGFVMFGEKHSISNIHRGYLFKH